ncbi:uncharacterized protein LOC135493626 [Lineus longissimus]|uniref:uncharacterized protein LOC135493626 n=1 Tax=Lineus longissimus TaxID=88925 RepID=UPI00315CA8FD
MRLLADQLRSACYDIKMTDMAILEPFIGSLLVISGLRCAVLCLGIRGCRSMATCPSGNKSLCQMDNRNLPIAEDDIQTGCKVFKRRCDTKVYKKGPPAFIKPPVTLNKKYDAMAMNLEYDMAVFWFDGMKEADNVLIYVYREEDNAFRIQSSIFIHGRPEALFNGFDAARMWLIFAKEPGARGQVHIKLLCYDLKNNGQLKHTIVLPKGNPCARKMGLKGTRISLSGNVAMISCREGKKMRTVSIYNLSYDKPIVQVFNRGHILDSSLLCLKGYKGYGTYYTLNRNFFVHGMYRKDSTVRLCFSSGKYANRLFVGSLTRYDYPQKNENIKDPNHLLFVRVPGGRSKGRSGGSVSSITEVHGIAANGVVYFTELYLRPSPSLSRDFAENTAISHCDEILTFVKEHGRRKQIHFRKVNRYLAVR